MKTFQGKVITTKTPKTGVVAVVQTYKHPLYKKILTRIKKFPAHYEDLAVKVGDTVEIVEVRPISKTKHFQITKVIK